MILYWFKYMYQNSWLGPSNVGIGDYDTMVYTHNSRLTLHSQMIYAKFIFCEVYDLLWKVLPNKINVNISMQ